MADKAISELTRATQITPTDLFVMEQSGTAKSISGQTLIKAVAEHVGSPDPSQGGDCSDFCVIDATNGWSSIEQTYEEIQEAYASGVILVVYRAGYQFDLVSADDGFVFERRYVEDTKLVTARLSLRKGSALYAAQASVLDVPTDEHINELIDTALGVIENGTY